MDDADPRRDDPLYRRRHSLAHVLAQAVKELRPGARLGFGPPVEDGFYYDFLLGEPLSDKDLTGIEKRMRKLLQQGQRFQREDVAVEAALARLEAAGETLKAEYARELADRDGLATLSFYTNGPFTDMCEGPHVESTRDIPPDSFCLDSLAGAYWRGDEKRAQLTRVYGLAFQDAATLAAYLERRELARQRDHRKLGRELELFHISEEVGPGLVLWLPRGTVLRDELERYAEEEEFRAGYQRVATPHITKEGLYYTSGHLPYYKASMFPPFELEGESRYYLKPMNCPHHHIIYKVRPRSYRELPLRLAEYGTVYRYELSGALAGLLRVRGMAMNDAHIYCAPDQMRDEFRAVLDLHRRYYEHLRLTDYWMRLSLWDPARTEKFVADPEAWESSQEVLRAVLREMGVRFEEAPGEAAFYGPKVDFQVQNVIGREETASTNQLDFAMAERFALEFTGADGARHRPYIIHRAPLGTHERFVAFLIEHFGGAFPTWMAPVQAVVVPVAEAHLDYARRVQARLRGDLFRVEVDDTPAATFNKKVRNAATSKVPNVFIVGAREAEDESVTWRRYCVKEQPTLKLERLAALLGMLRRRRIMDNFPDAEIPETG